MTHNNEGVGTLPLPNIPARPRIFVHERQVPANVRRRAPCCAVLRTVQPLCCGVVVHCRCLKIEPVHLYTSSLFLSSFVPAV